MSLSLHMQTPEALNGIPEAKQRIKHLETEISALEGVLAERRSRLQGMQYDLRVKQQHVGITTVQQRAPIILSDSSSEEEEEEKHTASPAVYHSRKRRIIHDSEDESAALASPPPAPRSKPVSSPMRASPVNMPPAALPSSFAASSAAAAKKSGGDKLTDEQKKRKNAEYAVGDLVQVEYTTMEDGLEHIEFAEVTQMDPLPVGTRSGREKYRQMHIKWVYDYKALAEEIGEETLAQMDFMEGDYAFSNHGQQVNVYNCIGACNDKRELIEFDYDGEVLRKRDQAQQQAESKEEAEQEAEEHKQPAAKKAKLNGPVGLPRHEFIVMQFLQSYKVWTDTKYGRDLYFVINSLMSMGHAGNVEAREQLVHFFFEENMEPKSTTVEFDEIEAVKKRCDACGIKRWLKWSMTTGEPVDVDGWEVGSTCKGRIEALANICDYVARCRKEAKQIAGKPFTPYKMAKVVRELNELRSKAQEAIMGEHEKA